MTAMEQLQAILDAALDGGADYAEARAVDAYWESVAIKGYSIAGVQSGELAALSVTVRMGSGVGMASIRNPLRREIRNAALVAVEQARASTILGERELLPRPEREPEVGEWEQRVDVDPFGQTFETRAA
ncbi:MAG: hypothetical protein KC561_06675, partial [Myxococcales bacterium]|nr:hypothetical protein [Myxococcales bacterium]